MSNGPETNIVILGTGSHAKVVIEILEAMGQFDIIGCLSGDPDAPISVLGYSFLGDWDSLPEVTKKGVQHAAIGVGGWTSNDFRKEIFALAKSRGLAAVTAIHPSVILSKSATIGEGSVIYAGAVIQNEVSIGTNTIISAGSLLEHEAILEDHVLVSTGVSVGARATIREGALLAIGSTVVGDVTVGKNALVAAGAVVVNDVPDGARVYGVPAKEKS